MKLFNQLFRSAVLLVPALAMLLGASSAWGQVQVYQSWKLSTTDGKLVFLDFEQGQAIVDNAGDAEVNVQRDFVDIAYAATGLDLLTIVDDELWVYFGGVYPEAPTPPDPETRQEPKMVVKAADIGLRDLVTVATDPFAAEPTALIIGQAKGKPVFQAYLCTFDFEPEPDQPTDPPPPPTYDCGDDPIAKEFPRPIASAYVPNDATGDLAGDGGFIVTGGTEVVFIESDGTTTTVFKKQGVLDGGERITDVAFFSGNDLLLATDDRRVLRVDAVAGGGNTFTEFRSTEGAGAAPCTADRDQLLTVDVTEDQGQTLVMVGDSACGEATLYDGIAANGTTGTSSFDPISVSMPESGTVAEGEFLDLRTCLNQGGCPFDDNGDAAVTVQKVEGSANAILYYVENMEDCRCNSTCVARGITVGPNGEVNWIDFLPEEVKNLVADPSYIPGYLQGTQARACKIKAFIVKTEEDTRTGIAEGSWEIGNLFNDGRATQCVTGISRSDDPIVDNIVGPGWDVVIYSPTRGKGVCPDCDNNLLVPEIGEYPDDLGNGIPGGLESNLATPFCGSSGVRTRSKSIFGVGFTVVPVDNQMPGVGVTHQLITDLGTAIVELAQPLLSVDEYAILQDRYFNQVLDKWENAKSKLVNQPNAADTNLGALTAQLRNLRNENEFPPEDGFQGYADNPDNIQGDIETRIDVLLFWIDERLRQLIPLDGYDTTAP